MTSRVCVWLATLAVAGCGFQLRTWDLAETFATASIEAQRGVDLDIDLGRALESAGIRVVDSGADVVIRLSGQRDDRRSVSVTRGARTAEYELALQVTFAVTDVTGSELAAERVIRSERVARLDRDNLVGSSEERALLATEVRNDLVGQMVRTLSTLSKNADGTHADPG